MTRFLALLLLALAAPAAAAPRNFAITSFERIRMEAPFDVTVATGKSPSARAEAPVAALDTVDLRVEGNTLIIRRRSSSSGDLRNVPVRITLGTPALRSATLLGSGRLRIDRMSSQTVNLALAGPGKLEVADLRTDRLDLLAAGSGAVTIAGLVKEGRINAEGTGVIDAAALQSDALVIFATGNSEVRASARRIANVTASGAATVSMSNLVVCTQRVTGSASVSNCR